MFGGTETVAPTIEWTMAELMVNPEDMGRVQEELADVVGLDCLVHEDDLDNLPFLKCAIKETLRLHPPIPLLHETVEVCEVARYSVPAVFLVMVNVWAICRAATAWMDPGEFRTAPFACSGEAAAPDFKGNCFEFLPFGSGRRSLPGHAAWDGPTGTDGGAARSLLLVGAIGDMRPSELDMGDVFRLTGPRAVRLVARGRTHSAFDMAIIPCHCRRLCC